MDAYLPSYVSHLVGAAMLACSALNPFIYTLYSTKFRKRLGRLAHLVSKRVADRDGKLASNKLPTTDSSATAESSRDTYDECVEIMGGKE